MVLYGLALLAFTLYPLPNNMAEFCHNNHLSPQLNPLQFINDIRLSGIRAILQIALNVVFFLPLGVFLRNLFGFKFRWVVLLSALVSLTIEVLQLTAVLGIFECSYRLFDVDDILINTIGGALGYFMGFILPNLSRSKIDNSTPNLKPKLIERLVVLWADIMFVNIFAGFYILVLKLFGIDVTAEISLIIQIVFFATFELILPLVWKGQTIFSHFANISLDNKSRKPANRLIFYCFRATILGLIIYNGGWISFCLAVILAVFYIVKRQPLYSLMK